MHIPFFIALFLTLIIPNCAMAQLGYQAELEWIRYPELSQSGENQFAYGLVGLDYQHVINRNLRFFSAINVRRSDPGESRDQKRINELYLDYRHTHFDLRSGFQHINWGRADIVNPLDFSPQDFRDPLDDDNEDLPVAGFNLTYYLSESQLHWIVMPYFIESEIPESKSVWFAKLPSQTLLGQNIEYHLAKSDQPESGFKNWQTAIKWGHRGRGFDWAVSYFYGWNDVPQLKQSNQVIDSSTVKVILQPTYFRQHTLGFDSAWLLDEYSFRSEIAYKHSRDDEGNDPYIDDPYLHVVMGVDRTIQDILFGKDLLVLFEYSYQQASTDIEYQANDLDHIFENTLFTRLGMDNLPKWEMQVDFAIDLASEGYFIRPQLTYEWFDNFTTQVSLEYLEGNKNSFFGSYKDNKAIRFRITKEGIL